MKKVLSFINVILMVLLFLNTSCPDGPEILDREWVVKQIDYGSGGSIIYMDLLSPYYIIDHSFYTDLEFSNEIEIGDLISIQDVTTYCSLSEGLITLGVPEPLDPDIHKVVNFNTEYFYGKPPALLMPGSYIRCWFRDASVPINYF